RGMQTMEQSLGDLIMRRVVELEVGLSRSSRPAQLIGLLERSGFPVDLAADLNASLAEEPPPLGPGPAAPGGEEWGTGPSRRRRPASGASARTPTRLRNGAATSRPRSGRKRSASAGRRRRPSPNRSPSPTNRPVRKSPRGPARSLSAARATPSPLQPFLKSRRS